MWVYLRGWLAVVLQRVSVDGAVLATEDTSLLEHNWNLFLFEACLSIFEDSHALSTFCRSGFKFCESSQRYVRDCWQSCHSAMCASSQCASSDSYVVRKHSVFFELELLCVVAGLCVSVICSVSVSFASCKSRIYSQVQRRRCQFANEGHFPRWTVPYSAICARRLAFHKCAVWWQWPVFLRRLQWQGCSAIQNISHCNTNRRRYCGCF